MGAVMGKFNRSQLEKEEASFSAITATVRSDSDNQQELFSAVFMSRPF